MSFELAKTVLKIQEPWVVDEVVTESQPCDEVQVHVYCREGTELACPECGWTTTQRYDHAPRALRDLDWGEHQVWLHIRVPRIQCKTHGIKRIQLPWVSKPKVHTTIRFEQRVLDELGSCSQAEVGRKMSISAAQVARIMKDAVARGLSRRRQKPLSEIGVDETSFARRHDYVTIVNDLDGRVVHVADGRD